MSARLPASGAPIPGMGGTMGGAVGRAGFIGRGVGFSPVATPAVGTLAAGVLMMPDFAVDAKKKNK